MGITAIRDEAGISVRELAARAHVSPSTVYRYERGLTNPRRINRLMLADALGVPAFALDTPDSLAEMF